MEIKKDMNGNAIIVSDQFIATNHRIAKGKSGEFEMLSDCLRASPDGSFYYNKKTIGISLSEVEDSVLNELGLSRLLATDDDFI